MKFLTIIISIVRYINIQIYIYRIYLCIFLEKNVINTIALITNTACILTLIKLIYFHDYTWAGFFNINH